MLGDTKRVEISCPRSRMNRLNYVTVSSISVRLGWLIPGEMRVINSLGQTLGTFAEESRSTTGLVVFCLSANRAISIYEYNGI